MMIFLFINKVRWNQHSQNCHIYFSKFLAVPCLGYFVPKHFCFVYCICWSLFSPSSSTSHIVVLCLWFFFNNLLTTSIFNTRSQNHPFDLFVKNIHWLISGTTMHPDNPCTLAEAGGSDVEEHPQLHTDFEVDLNYMIPCLKKRLVDLIPLLGFDPLAFFSE